MRQVVRMVNPVTQSRLQRTGNLVLDRKAKRLKKTMRKRANACVNVLKQCGWLVDEMEMARFTTYETIAFDAVSLARGAIARYCYQLTGHFNKRPRWLLIGGKQFHEITLQLCHWPLSVPLESFHGYPDLQGLQVHVLPWLDGVVMVPEEFLPAREVPTSVMLVQPGPEVVERLARELVDQWRSDS